MMWGVFRQNSDVLSYCRWRGVLWKSYSSPLYFLFVVPFGTYLNYDEDIDILVEFSFMLIWLELIGFSFYSIMFCFYGCSFNSCLTFIWGSIKLWLFLFLFKFKKSLFEGFLKILKVLWVQNMMLVLWIESVFSHGSDVCHIVYGI